MSCDGQDNQAGRGHEYQEYCHQGGRSTQLSTDVENNIDVS
jgi:hypothetical protein